VLVETTVVVVVVETVVGLVIVAKSTSVEIEVSVTGIVVKARVSMSSVTVGLVEKMVSEVLITLVDVVVGVGILRQLQAVDILDDAKSAIHAGRLPLLLTSIAAVSSCRFLRVATVVVETVLVMTITLVL